MLRVRLAAVKGKYGEQNVVKAYKPLQPAAGGMPSGGQPSAAGSAPEKRSPAAGGGADALDDPVPF